MRRPLLPADDHECIARLMLNCLAVGAGNC